MQPPAFGNTSIGSRLFTPVGIPVVSGDQQIALAAQGTKVVSKHLRKTIARDYSPFRIDETIQRIFDSGAGEALVRMWLEHAGEGDFALDAYVPPAHHALVEEIVAGLGYLPVRLQWDRVGPRLLPAEAIGERAEAFYLSMAAPGTTRPKPDVGGPDHGTATGFVDEVSFEDGCLVIRGWAVDATGALPGCLGVRINGRTQMVENFATQSRPDVQRHLHLSHALVGYRAMLEIPGVVGLGDVESGFGVFVPSAGDIRLAGRVVRLLAEKGKQQNQG
jgi:hypothetical protein